MPSRIIVHNFPAVAEEFGTDLHLPFSIFTNLLGHSGNSAQNNFQNFLSNSSVLASDACDASVVTSDNDLTHATSVITSDNGLSHENTTSATTSSDGFRRKYPHIKRIGTSIHSVEDAVFAESHGADYITAGHIFTTDCKKGLPGRGIDWLKSICNAVSIPVYAIGGISDANVSMLSDCNISGYCMMSASMKPILSE
ncbi:MAG: thiamine phosphate synthase [Lachnospiraceae bacterium]|nr:thiamine phosphate synthase [Lachnospiraceae bacterium]